MAEDKKETISYILDLIRTWWAQTQRTNFINVTFQIKIMKKSTEWLFLQDCIFLHIMWSLQAGMTDTSAVTILFTPMFESAPRTSPHVKAKNCRNEKWERKTFFYYLFMNILKHKSGSCIDCWWRDRNL